MSQVTDQKPLESNRLAHLFVDGEMIGFGRAV